MNTSNRHLQIITLSLIFAVFAVVGIGIKPSWGQTPFEMPATKDLKRIRSAVISTSQGDFLVELLPDVAPIHVANFKYLADKDFYKDLTFHLYHPGYIIQGGDPTGTGNGGPGYSLQPEFSTRRHQKGVVGMSRKSDEINPQRLSNGSQFHILLGDAPKMDKKYTIFGQVVDGMEVVDKLKDGDRIRNIKVFLKDSR